MRALAKPPSQLNHAARHAPAFLACLLTGVRSEPARAYDRSMRRTTHCTERAARLAWVADVLADFNDTSSMRVLIYSCGLVPLDPAVRTHPRVVLRSKRGALARTTPFYSFFDHVMTTYDSLAAWTLFLHPHDTSYHRLTPIRSVVRQCRALIELQNRQKHAGRVDGGALQYVNVGDSVVSTWAGCSRLRSARASGRSTDSPLASCQWGLPCPGMPTRVHAVWPTLERALSARSTLSLFGRARSADVPQPPPDEFVDLHGAEALVHRCRLLARPRAAWSRLRGLTIPSQSNGGQKNGLLDYSLEGTFPVIMGEPWVRPALQASLHALNFNVCFRSPNATLASRHSVHNRVYRKFAAPVEGGGPTSAARDGWLEPSQKSNRKQWNTWRRQWLNGTELALRSRGLLSARTPSLGSQVDQELVVTAPSRSISSARDALEGAWLGWARQHLWPPQAQPQAGRGCEK